MFGPVFIIKTAAVSYAIHIFIKYKPRNYHKCIIRFIRDRVTFIRFRNSVKTRKRGVSYARYGYLFILPFFIAYAIEKMAKKRSGDTERILSTRKITVIGVVINILLTTTAAYVLTRPGLMFKRGIMVFLIIMMLFDPGTVPEYLTVRRLGLLGSQWSVILVTAVSVYYLIIMMRYFQAVPQEICESGLCLEEYLGRTEHE